jgi:hypothetical protein
MHSKSFTGSSGHSFGGSILLKYLTDGYTGSLPGVGSLSRPQLGAQTLAYDELAAPKTLGSRLPASWIFLYHSRDDPEVPFVHFRYYPELSVRRIGSSPPVGGAAATLMVAG